MWVVYMLFNVLYNCGAKYVQDHGFTSRSPRKPIMFSRETKYNVPTQKLAKCEVGFFKQLCLHRE